ncbi:MAG: hypothetical protein M0Q44_11055 [Methylobacter sp.]|jgi:hypothetical protein|nr:hypothetical protein [Methylobacter sp.]
MPEISCIKDIALTMAALSSIYVGLAGLDTWKRQLRGNNEYILAKSASIALYELREAIILVRSPFYHPDVKTPNTDELRKLDDQQWKQLESDIILQEHHKSLKKIKVAEEKLKSCLLEIEAILGLRFSKEIEPISSLINELSFAKREVWLHNAKLRGGSNNFNDKDYEKIEDFEKTLYKNSVDKDEYMEKLERAILDIKTILKPYIE